MPKKRGMGSAKIRRRQRRVVGLARGTKATYVKIGRRVNLSAHEVGRLAVKSRARLPRAERERAQYEAYKKRALEIIRRYKQRVSAKYLASKGIPYEAANAILKELERVREYKPNSHRIRRLGKQRPEVLEQERIIIKMKSKGASSAEIMKAVGIKNRNTYYTRLKRMRAKGLDV